MENAYFFKVLDYLHRGGGYFEIISISYSCLLCFEPGFSGYCFLSNIKPCFWNRFRRPNYSTNREFRKSWFYFTVSFVSFLTFMRIFVVFFFFFEFDLRFKKCLAFSIESVSHCWDSAPCTENNCRCAKQLIYEMLTYIKTFSYSRLAYWQPVREEP